MKRFLIFPVIVLSLACIDLTGIEDTSKYAEELLEALQVDSVVCDPMTLSVDSVGTIVALNSNGVELLYEGLNAVILINSDPNVIALDLTGEYIGLSVGQSNITARGADATTASCVISVQ